MTMRKIFSMQLEDGKTAELYGKDVGDLEIFMDGAWGFTVTGGMGKVNLYTVTPLDDNDVERREVVARLTMSLPTIFAMRDFFAEQCQVLLDHGIIVEKGKAAPAKKGKAAQ